MAMVTMRRSKAQSALEYLSTYAMTMLIVAVVIAAIFALGILNAGSYAPKYCTVTGFNCIAYPLAANGMLYLNLQNVEPYTVNVTGIGCNENNTVTNMQAPPGNRIQLIVNANYTFSTQCYALHGTAFSGSIGSIFKGFLLVNYTKQQVGIPTIGFGNIETSVSIK